MDGYMLYRKEGHTAVVLIAEDDQELFYLVSKLAKTRNKGLKTLAQTLQEEFFKEQN